MAMTSMSGGAAPGGNQPGGDWFGSNGPPAASAGGSEAGKSSEQQLRDAAAALGWDPNNAGAHRGHQQELVDWLQAHGGGDWYGAKGSANPTADFGRADDWMQDPSGRSFDIFTTGGQFVTNPDDPTAGTGGAPGAGGANAYLSDPSYQFTFDQALQGAQRSAAAKGTLMSGGFQKALANYLGGVASQGYNQQFGRLFNVASLGADMAARQAAQNSAYATAAGQGAEGVGNAQAAGSVAQGNTWGGLANDVGQIGAYYTLFGPHGSTAPAGQYFDNSGGYTGP